MAKKKSRRWTNSAKLAFGVMLAPASGVSLWTALRTLSSVASRASHGVPFIVGFAGYALFHVFFPSPMRLYILGHEASHALAGWLSGASILGFHVGKREGHVDLSHSNAWIALAPYVIPIYSILAVLVYRLWIWQSTAAGSAGRWGFSMFLFAMGVTLAFHFSHTAEAVWASDQPDLHQAGGIIFSLSLIVFLNGIILLVAAKCLFPGVVALGKTMGSIWRSSRFFWFHLGNLALSRLHFGAHR